MRTEILRPGVLAPEPPPEPLRDASFWTTSTISGKPYGSPDSASGIIFVTQFQICGSVSWGGVAPVCLAPHLVVVRTALQRINGRCSVRLTKECHVSTLI